MGGGGAKIRKKISSMSRIEEKKIEQHQHHQKKYRAQKISKLAILYISVSLSFFSVECFGSAPWLTIPEVYMQNTNRYKPVLTTLTSIVQLSTNYLNGIPKNPNLNTESPTYVNDDFIKILNAGLLY